MATKSRKPVVKSHGKTLKPGVLAQLRGLQAPAVNLLQREHAGKAVASYKPLASKLQKRLELLKRLPQRATKQQVLSHAEKEAFIVGKITEHEEQFSLVQLLHAQKLKNKAFKLIEKLKPAPETSTVASTDKSKQPMVEAVEGRMARLVSPEYQFVFGARKKVEKGELVLNISDERIGKPKGEGIVAEPLEHFPKALKGTSPPVAKQLTDQIAGTSYAGGSIVSVHASHELQSAMKKAEVIADELQQLRQKKSVATAKGHHKRFRQVALKAQQKKLEYAEATQKTFGSSYGITLDTGQKLSVDAVTLRALLQMKTAEKEHTAMMEDRKRRGMVRNVVNTGELDRQKQIAIEDETIKRAKAGTTFDWATAHAKASAKVSASVTRKSPKKRTKKTGYQKGKRGGVYRKTGTGKETYKRKK